MRSNEGAFAVPYSSCVTRRQRRGRTEYVAVLSYYDHSGKRRQKRRTEYSHSEAKRITRELEDEYVSGGEVALFSDNLTFEDLASVSRKHFCLWNSFNSQKPQWITSC